MTEVSYDKAITAQLIIDPYNDFISEGGKLWDRLRGVAEANKAPPRVSLRSNEAGKARLGDTGRRQDQAGHRLRLGDQ
ncbi:MAG: ureidoacrylate peracid hydrolase [Mycobacterium sp.]|jgi:ureidoacrylate peracid hydrolase|nr:ureidoacrylate peracid hydrolase [Mycobacterium sp.]